MQACGFRDHRLEIEAQNAVVLGVSADGWDSHVKFKTKYNLPFTLLVDPDYRIAEAYGVLDKKSLRRFLFSGLRRSHFVIDEDGRILAAHYGVAANASATEALATLREAAEKT